MTVHLVIRIGRDALDSVAAGRPVNLGVAEDPEPSVREQAPIYRAGSHPKKLLDWAERRGRDFETDDVVKALRVTRSHASMILNKVVKDPGPIRRVSRGVYRFAGAKPRKRSPSKKK